MKYSRENLKLAYTEFLKSGRENCTAKEMAGIYLLEHGDQANKSFLDSVDTLDLIFFDEVIMCLNGCSTDSDNEIVRCKFCGSYSLWGGYDGDPTYWECEECNDIFCGDCCKVNNETDKFILCKDCKSKNGGKIK